MCLVVLRILAYRADLVEKTFELSAAVSAPAVFYICRLLSLGIRRKRPVIRLDLAVAYIQELRTVIKGSGIFLVFIRVAALVKLSIALKGHLFKAGAVRKGEGIDSLDTLWDKQLFKT